MAEIMADDEWQRLWREGQTGWDRGRVSPVLETWLPAPSDDVRTVLVPGCGRGYEVVELAKRGFEVTAVDWVEQPLEALRADLARRGLSATVERADLFEWQPAAAFDAIYEQTCLCAIDPSRRDAYEGRCRSWLKAGGRLFALFMQTGREQGPPFDCPIDAMSRLFSAPDWHWPNSVSVDRTNDNSARVDHPSGLFEIPTVLVRGG